MKKIIRFGIVGFIATIIDFILLFIFKELLNINVIIANTLSFTISVIYNYIASIKYVFDVDKNKNGKIQFILFIIFSVLGLILNNLILYLLTSRLNIYYLLSKVIATIFVMVFNFITRKKFLEWREYNICKIVV